jgi:uncharacterized protein YbjT (DUF2867 family)
MSILLVGPSPEIGPVLIERLTAQGDEVRVIERDPQLADRWRGLGAFVAQGSADDADLIERAAHSCRTMVFLDVDGGVETLAPALEGARATTIDRVVLITVRGASACLELLRATDVDYVFVRCTPHRSLLHPRRRPDVSLIAEVVDAADDLAGNPRLELDLSDPATRPALGLSL